MESNRQNTIASFDVFDTLLTRQVGKPTSLFLLLGRKLAQEALISCSPAAFARARIEAEDRARQNSATDETTLDAIYEEVAETLGIGPATCRKIRDIECELEISLTKIVPGAKARLEAERKLGKKVAFVSDMYLPQQTIQTMLQKHNLMLEGDACYVSSEFGKQKADGKLFEEVLKQEGWKPLQITHLGNNWLSDVAAPRRLSMKSVFMPEANPNRYEKILENYTFATEGLASAMAGAARLARLSVQADTPKARAIRDVVAGVGAPALASYVLWILRKAKELNLDTLYFVSRDGQILLQIARKFALKVGITCDLRYLYGSRQSWHSAALHSIGDLELSWILSNTRFLSARIIARRLDVAPELLAAEFKAAGVSEKEWDRNLTDEEIEKLRGILKNDRVSDLLTRVNAESKRLFTSYLRQEGLLSDARWAIVDVGWHGRMQTSLGRALADAGGPAPTGLFFGIIERPPFKEAGDMHGYFYDYPRRRGFLEMVPALATQIEMFCSASHGLVLGYQEQEGEVGPRMNEQMNTMIIQWGLPIMQATIRKFADYLTLDSSLVNIDADMRPAIADLLRTFWREPTPEEAQAWAAFPFEDDQAATFSFRLAEKYGIRDLWKMLRHRKVERVWPAACWKVTSFFIRKLHGCLKYIGLF